MSNYSYLLVFLNRKLNFSSWMLCLINFCLVREAQWAGLKFDCKKGEFSFEIPVPNCWQLTCLGTSGVFWPREYISVSFSPALIALGVCGNFLCLNRWLNKEKPLSEWLAPVGENLTSRRSAASASRRTTWANKINADVEPRFKKRRSVQTLIRPYTKAVRPPVMLTALCYYRRCDRSLAHHRIYILITSLINGVALWLHLWHSGNLI